MQERLKTLTIKEASQRLGVTCHTLRFWEKEVDGVIVPLRTPGGQRRYTPGHLAVIERIKHLKSIGLRLIDIRSALQNRENRLHADANLSPQGIEFLANHIADMVKSAIYRIFSEENLEYE